MKTHSQLIVKHPIFLLLILLLTSVSAKAQDLAGKVTNQNNTPVEGAYVFHAKSGHHAHTNSIGKFLLHDVEIGDSITVTMLGFEKVTLAVTALDQELHITIEEQNLALDEIIISPDLDAMNVFTQIDIKTSPVQSAQEFLQKVPGLIIGQHAGGGKAEQIFLRGFDIDHGTDISIRVDGMPVNMVSHAHGQGYADMHWLIPETIGKVDFGKGPYYARHGNFATAGYAEFQTKESLDESLIQMEVGQFNTLRTVGMFNILKTKRHSAYIASELLLTDGPFSSPQNFSRINVMGKYTGYLPNQDYVSLQFSHFNSTWDASGQIPVRAVQSGLIDRWGAIDDTEGGTTGRNNVKLQYNKTIDENTFVNNSVYFSQYDFELFSNFTFFLEDEINGDQIVQRENRQLMGGTSELNQYFTLGNYEGLFQAAVGFRNDQSKGNELSHTMNRKTTLETLKLGDINETNIFGYVNVEFDINKWVINPSIRFDHFKFQYKDALATTYQSNAVDKTIISPKLNILYTPNQNIQLFLKTGKGFHTNDSRVSIQEADVIPAAYGADIGTIWKPTPKLLVTSALWYLFLEQEFVYVGDAGIVEPSGKTRRLGVDFGVRYQLAKGVFFDTDVNYAFARSIEEEAGNDYIPLAPDLTATAGISFLHDKGFYGSIKSRYIKDRPANEDNSIVAEGYFLTDINAGYQWKRLDLSISIKNVFDTEWNDAQFATESRLKDELLPVEEIHFTPGSPFFIKMIAKYRF